MALITNSQYMETTQHNEHQAHETVDSRWFDLAGMALSFLCLIHCIALPVLLSALPWLMPNFAEDEMTHKVLALMVIPVGSFGLISGYRKHLQLWIPIWGIAGLLCIGCAAFAGEQLGEHTEHTLSVLGSIQLVIAHFFNYRAHKACSCSH